MLSRWRVAASLVLIAVLAGGSSGCQTKAQSGALIGGAAGAGLGAAIGSGSANAGKGALIGGAVGTVGGYIIGNEADKKERREREAAYYPPRDNYGYPSAPKAPAKVAVSDVVAWTRSGVKDAIIIDRVERSGVVFHITAAQENYLRDSGVGEEVVRAMKDTARR